MKRLLLLIVSWSAGITAMTAGETWQEALRQMPMSATMLLNRDNAVDALLDAFQSNAVVKALVVLRGVADDFYLINRDAPRLNLRATNLLDAVSALTNATAVRATFKAPFLLLYVERDALQAACVIEEHSIADRLKVQSHLPHVHYSDAHWEEIQPALQKALARLIRPAGLSSDAWHFNRHNLVGWGLTDWEVLSGLTMTGGTTVTVQKHAIVFQVRGTR